MVIDLIEEYLVSKKNSDCLDSNSRIRGALLGMCEKEAGYRWLRRPLRGRVEDVWNEVCYRRDDTLETGIVWL